MLSLPARISSFPNSTTMHPLLVNTEYWYGIGTFTRELLGFGTGVGLVWFGRIGTGVGLVWEFWIIIGY